MRWFYPSFLLCSFVFSSISHGRSPSSYRNAIDESYKIIRERYVDDIKDDKILDGMMSGVASSLDRYSMYLNESDLKSTIENVSGEFGGLGIEITKEDAFVRIISPIDDTPAAKAGIQAGDIITHINDEIIDKMSLYEAVTKMRGKPGKVIKLKIFRKNQGLIDFSIRRAIISTSPVKSKILDNDIALFRISHFDSKSTDSLLKEIDTINPNEMNGLIIDLRNNPGGLLDQVVDMTGMFLPEGKKIVSIKDKNNNLVKEFLSKSGMINNKNIVILINKGSASASEIFAGAMKSHKHAILVGETTFGKGSVQEIIPLKSLKKSAIKMTVAKYFLPNGQSIEGIGIKPDILINDSDDNLSKLVNGKPKKSLKNEKNEKSEDLYIKKAIEILTKNVQKKEKAYRFGILAEYLVVVYMFFLGYRSIYRRYRNRYGEIDIIFKRFYFIEKIFGKIIVFAEVKGRKSGDIFDVVSKKQIQRIRNSAECFVNQKRLFHYDQRFDIFFVHSIFKPLIHIRNVM